MFEQKRNPWNDGYWHAQQNGGPNNPWEKGTWMNEEWWFGYQQGVFENLGLGESLKRSNS